MRYQSTFTYEDNPNSDLSLKKAHYLPEHWQQLHYRTADIIMELRPLLEFANKFPKSDQAGPALVRAAATFESMAQLDAAASVLIKMSERMKDSQAKWKGHSAADYYAMSGHASEARKLYQEFDERGERG